MGWSGGWDGGGWLMMLFGGLIFLLLLAGAVVLAVLAFWALARPGQAPRSDAVGPVQPDDRALAILRERYARGELSKEQYEQMRVDLRA